MKHASRIATSLVPLLCALVQGFAAEKEEGWNPDTKFPPLSPAEAIKTIEIPKGCRMECIASEPMVEEPASFTFDGNGALYRCGDYEDVAEKILRTYANDLHAPCARHAQAILNEPAKP